MSKTQQEVITWHRASDRPENETKIMLQTRDEIILDFWYFDFAGYLGCDVIAWAEMPKGYKEE